MPAQHLAAHPSRKREVASLESQRGAMTQCAYLSDLESAMIAPRKPEGSLTSIEAGSAHLCGQRLVQQNRSYRCRRTSYFWQCSALPPLLPPVRASSRPKNLSWSIPSPSRSSQSTPANTSNTISGQAFGPALAPDMAPDMALTLAPQISHGGVPC